MNKPILFIEDKSKSLPKRVLCVGIKSADGTMIIHKEGAKK